MPKVSNTQRGRYGEGFHSTAFLTTHAEGCDTLHFTTRLNNYWVQALNLEWFKVLSTKSKDPRLHLYRKATYCTATSTPPSICPNRTRPQGCTCDACACGARVSPPSHNHPASVLFRISSDNVFIGSSRMTISDWLSTPGQKASRDCENSAP